MTARSEIIEAMRQAITTQRFIADAMMGHTKLVSEVLPRDVVLKCAQTALAAAEAKGVKVPEDGTL